MITEVTFRQVLNCSLSACAPVSEMLDTNLSMFAAIRLFMGAGLVIVLSGLTVAQDPACLERTVSLNVADQTGARLQNLNLVDFKGEIHGKPVRMVSLTPDVEPHRVRILLDASSSMLEEHSDKWTVALRVAQDIVKAFPERYQISLFTFSTGIDFSLDSADRSVLMNKLQEFALAREALYKEKRRTALFDSVSEAITRDSNLQSGDALYVITDGGDNSSQERIKTIEDELLSKGVRLFAFVFDDLSGMPVVLESEGGADELAAMARDTGGYVATLRPDPRTQNSGMFEYRSVLDDLTTLDRLLQNQFRQMAFYNLLRVSLPEPIDKRRSWKLTRLVPKGSPHKEISMFYPQKLLPCGTRAGAAEVSKPQGFLPRAPDCQASQ